MKQQYLILLFILCLLGPQAQAQYARGQVVAAIPIPQLDLTAAQTQAVINSLSPLDLPDFILNLLIDIDYDIKGFKVIYGTVNAHGQPTVASGLVVVPQIGCPKDMVVYCHGTVFAKGQVPSNGSGAADGSEILLALLYGGNGYVTVLPDYLGLGDSPGFHPYLDETTEAAATVDLMVATRTLAGAQGVALTNKVNISGYSQGGHAGMSTFKFLQEVSNAGFNVKRAGLGSGPYNLAGVQYDATLNNPFYARPEFVLYALASCQETIGNIYTTDPGEVIAAPFVDLYNEEILGQTGNVSWVVSPYSDMLTDEFYQELQTNPYSNVAYQCLAASDVSNWNDRLPTEMYYCTADQEVDFHNSLVTEHQLENNLPWYLFWMRALINSRYLGNLTHGDCVIPYTLVSKLRFDLFQSPCHSGGRSPGEDQWAGSEEPLLPQASSFYYLDIRTTSLAAPVAKVELLRFDGSIAATFTEFDTKADLIRLDVRAVERGALVVRVTDTAGQEINELTLLEPIELLTHPAYNPLAYDPTNKVFELDLSLLPEPVQSLLIYDQAHQLVREIAVEDAPDRMTIAAEGLTADAYTLEVRTATNSFFVELPGIGQPQPTANDGLVVFPNPAQAAVSIRLTGDEEMATATLFDNQGRALWRLGNIRGREIHPNLQLPAGVYLLQVTTSSGKVLVQRLVLE
jgi:hypothetical protein